MPDRDLLSDRCAERKADDVSLLHAGAVEQGHRIVGGGHAWAPPRTGHPRRAPSDRREHAKTLLERGDRPERHRRREADAGQKQDRRT